MVQIHPHPSGDLAERFSDRLLTYVHRFETDNPLCLHFVDLHHVGQYPVNVGSSPAAWFDRFMAIFFQMQYVPRKYAEKIAECDLMTNGDKFRGFIIPGALGFGLALE